MIHHSRTLLLATLLAMFTFSAAHSFQAPGNLRDAYRGQKEYSDSLAGVIQQFNAHINADSIQATMQSLEDFGTRFALAENRKEVAEWIKGRFMDAGYQQARLDSFAFNTYYQGNYYQTMQYNVVVTYEGHQNPDSVLVLGAHYDSIVTGFNDPFEDAPGADDNASGVAAALEIARIMKTHGYAPAYTIKFVLFAAEELGLHGAWDYADKAIAQEMDIYCMINNDMIGYTTQMPGQWTVNMQAYPGADWYTNLAHHIINNHTSLQFTQSSQFIHASDSWAFHQNGFNAVFFIEDEFNPYYHTVNDLMIHTNKHFVAEITKISLGMLIYLNGSGHTDAPMYVRWAGTEDQDWTNTHNWHNGLLPSENAAVTIPSDAVHDPVLTSIVTLRDLMVEEDAQLTIGRGGALIVKDMLVNEAGPKGLLLDAGAGEGSALPVLIHHSDHVMARIKQAMGGYKSRGEGSPWQWISTPVTGQDIEGFVSVLDGAGFDLMRWEEPAGQWLSFADGGGPPDNDFAHTEMMPGSGYVFAPFEHATFAWEGELHAGSFTWNNLSNQGQQPGDIYQAGWNLVGNPWTSGILVDHQYWHSEDASTELTPKYWYQQEAGGSYKPYRDGETIPPHKAFYVQAIKQDASDALLVIEKEARTPGTDDPAAGNYIVLAAEELSEGSKQFAYVRVEEKALTGYDHRFDATFAPGIAPLFHASREDHHLLVYAVPELHEELIIPYHFEGLEYGSQYAIHLEESIANNTLYLADKKLDSLHQLSHDAPYLFDDIPDEDTQRFLLCFDPPDDPTSIADADGGIFMTGEAWVYERTLYLKGWSEDVRLDLFDLTGRRLQGFRPGIGKETHYLHVPTGVYLLRAVGQSGVSGQKIVVD